MAVYTQIDNPELFFQVKTYSGTGSSNTITLDGSENMEPSLTWIKSRSHTYSHVWRDAVRGANSFATNNTNKQYSSGTEITSFNSDGFTLGTDSGVNNGSHTFVSWNWKADGSGSSNSEGDITATVSAETTAGFSIIKFTGNGSHSQSIGHGLNGTPTFWGVKNLTDDGVDFTMYWKGTDRIKLTTTEVMEQNYLMSASSTLLTTPSNASWVGGVSGKDYIMYAWQQLQGYSKFGTYVGNGSTSGPYIHLGFRAAFIICKVASGTTNDWTILDNKRDTFNVSNSRLYANTSGAESDADRADFTANGFKHRGDGNDMNGSGHTYFYMAFAESPFVNSKGVPNNSR